MKRKVLWTALLLAAVLVLGPILFSGSTPEPEPYVDSQEYVRSLPEEEVVIIGEKILTCKNGELPDHAFAICFRLQEIDPELAEKAFRHIETMAIPASKPAERQGLFRSQKQDRFGVYVRDGNGGYYEYYDYDENGNMVKADSAVQGEAPAEPLPAETGEIEPYNYTDYDPVTNPKGNKQTSSICKIYARKNGVALYGSGFFVGRKYVATAAHVIYIVAT